jgi:protein AroM
MTDRVLGIATIGQAPRDDIARLFASYCPAGTRIVLRGCLDGLGPAEIARLAPRDGGETLYTRLADGRDATVAKPAIVERAPQTLAALKRDGAGVIVFACTGAFPDGLGDGATLFPSRLLAGAVAALLPKGRLGLVIPLPEQGEQLAAKWRRPGLEVVSEALLPSAAAAAIAAAGRRIAAQRPDLVAMDCMSYTPETKRVLRESAGVPVLLAVTAVGRMVGELLE